MRFIAGCCVSLVAMQTIAAQEENPLDQYRSAAAQGGKAVQGRLIFLSEKSGCTKCHSVAEKKPLAGPDLAVIGDKFDRDQLIKSVLEPSAGIHPDFAGLTVVTTDGRTHNGILKKRTDTALEIFDAEGKAKTIPLGDVEDQQRSTTSLMPANLQKTMTPLQFADLIAYLQTLRQLVDDHPGMPSEIPILTSPARLIALHSAENRFDHPVWIVAKPGEKNTWLVVEQKTCRVWQLEKRKGSEHKTLFVDMSPESITGQFEGVLCLAFHPDFQNNGRYFLNHHVREDGIFSPVIVERRASDDRRIDSGSATRRLLKIKQETDLHWGGMLAFGPDGYLYIGAGDGGPQEDPDGHGQNLQTYQGKILRIDVDGTDGDQRYAIPKSNPFRDTAGVLPEIWAFGFRMPWRFSWDSTTKDLWVGDIGQNLFEEVTIAQAGANHGWNVYEGFTHFSDRYRRDGDRFRPPVFSYRRRHGVSVTGGYVYRGQRSPSFVGAYIFGDFESRRIWALTHRNGKLTAVRQIATCPEKPSSFGIDADGELFIVGYEGTVFRLILDDAILR